MSLIFGKLGEGNGLGEGVVGRNPSNSLSQFLKIKKSQPELISLNIIDIKRHKRGLN